MLLLAFLLLVVVLALWALTLPGCDHAYERRVARGEVDGVGPFEVYECDGCGRRSYHLND